MRSVSDDAERRQQQRAHRMIGTSAADEFQPSVPAFDDP